MRFTTEVALSILRDGPQSNTHTLAIRMRRGLGLRRFDAHEAMLRVRYMEEKGWVSCDRTPTGRLINIQITSAGRRLLQEQQVKRILEVTQ